MSKKQLVQNIRSLEAKMGFAGTHYERMVLRNCITTYKMKLQKLKKGKK